MTNLKPRGMVDKIYIGKHYALYILNIAVSLKVSEEFSKVFPHYKFTEANNPQHDNGKFWIPGSWLTGFM